MKNIIITALIVSNGFTAALLYAFSSGKVERGPQDAYAALYEPAKPVQLSRR